MGLQNSNIMICKNIKLDKSYKDVLNYTEQQMLSLCQNNAVASANNYSFIRGERGFIKTSFNYNDALKCNYMAFQNPDYSNKWFFAFIDDVIYDNDGTARIRYTVDEFSTCYVIREHVNSDEVGEHTYPEGLEFGDYIINVSGDVETLLDSNKYECIGVSYVPDNTPFDTLVHIYGGVFSGLTYFLFKTDDDAGKFIKAYASIGHSADIVNIFMIPSIIAGISDSDSRWFSGSLGGQTLTTAVLPNSAGVITIRNADINLSLQTTLNGYTPRNNKLLCYPYNCLTISNNAGTEAEYKYEDFTNNNPIFSLIGVPSPSCSVWLFPHNYKKHTGTKTGYNWGLPGGKYPMGSWNSDMYTNWMTQNGINILGMKIDAPMAHAIGGSLQMLTAGATHQYADIGTGLGSMLGAVQEQYRASMIPNQIGGQTTVGDVTFAYDKLAPTWYKMRIREEYARIIDDWFSRFGYKINRVKVPNQIGRKYWNYVQIGTSENIGYSPSTATRSVPASSMEIINTIYRNGTTIWHNHANIGNYSLDNIIV